MKKLTKTLSLVLVVAMVLSLCVIGAGATFTDNGKITKDYTEAVTIATDLGIVKGNANGAFNPAGTLTRAEAAVILAKMTVGSTADSMVYTKQTFKDVPASFWGYKYIEYAAAAGLTSGTSATTFSPNATLTGYQWALMVLKALGYTNEAHGITGANWAINTAKLYYGVKLSEVSISGTGITREEATQIAYDALFFGTVPSTKGTTTTINGVTVTTGTTEGTLDKTATLALTVFGVSKDSTNKTDAFGRPGTLYTCKTAAQSTAYGWTAKAKTVAATALKTYTNAKFNSTEITALTKAGWTGISSATVVYNGGADASVTYDKLAQTGYTVELYGEENTSGAYNVTKIVVTESYLAKVTAVSAKTGDITLQVREAGYFISKAAYKTVTVAAPVNNATPSANYKALSALKANDVVLLCVKPGWDTDGGFTVLGVQAVKTVTGTVTAIGMTGYYNGYVKIDGTQYTFANEYDQTALTVGGKYDFYLGADGYVYGAAVVTEANANIAFIRSTEAMYSTSLASTTSYAKASVVFPDGTAKVVDIYVTSTGAINGDTNDLLSSHNPTATATKVAANDWYSYVVQADGTYKFVSMPAGYANKTLASGTEILKGTAVMPNIGTATSATKLTVVYYNESTKAYTKTEYTGYANFPAVSAGEAVVKTNTVSGLVESIVVYTTTSVTTASTSFAYFLGASEVDVKGQLYSVIVNGEVKNYYGAANYTNTTNYPKAIYSVAISSDNTITLTPVATTGTAVNGVTYTARTGYVLAVDAGYILVGENASATSGTVYYLAATSTSYDASDLFAKTGNVITEMPAVGDTVSFVTYKSATTGLETVATVYTVAD